MYSNPNEQLDITLSILRRDSPPNNLESIRLEYYVGAGGEAYIDSPDDPFIEVLDKLVNDGYVRRVSFVGEPSLYFITFEGRVFSQNGGYVRKFADDNAEREQVKSNAKLALLGAWVAAIAASAFFIWDFIKYGLDHNWF